MLSPIVVGAIIGLLARSWLQVFIASLVVSAALIVGVNALMLRAIGAALSTSDVTGLLIVFALDAPMTLAGASVIFGIRRWRVRRVMIGLLLVSILAFATPLSAYDLRDRQRDLEDQQRRYEEALRQRQWEAEQQRREMEQRLLEQRHEIERQERFLIQERGYRRF